MTNNQIPMTNEKDNDQFTNNQLNKARGGLSVSFLFWLLVIGYCVFLWSLEFGHWSLSSSEETNLVRKGGCTRPKPLSYKEGIPGNGLFWTAVGHYLWIYLFILCSLLLTPDPLHYTPMEEKKSKEERYNEARILHKSLDEKLQMLQTKPYLTEDEEIEVKLLKKKKLYFKDMMESIRNEE